MSIDTLAFIKTFEEEQTNDELVLENIWYRSSPVEPRTRESSLAGTIVSLMQEASSFICISSGAGLPKAIVQEIPRISSRGVRVYILLADYDETITEFIADKAIVRITSDVSGFQLLIDPHKGLETKRGYFFSGHSFLEQRSGSSFYTPLNGVQLKEAFQRYIWKFWGASEELRGRKRITHSAGSRPPFDIYPLLQPEGYFYKGTDQDYITDKLTAIIRSARDRISIAFSHFAAYVNFEEDVYKKARDGVDVHIYTALQGDHRFIQQLNPHRHIHIHAVEVLDDCFVIADDKSGLLLSGSSAGDYETAIELSTIELQRLLILLKRVDAERWTYFREARLAELAADEVLVETFDGNLTEKSILEAEVIDHGLFVVEDLRQFFAESFKPPLKKEHRLARKLIHRWKVSPKILDDKAKKDPIYDQWEKSSTAFQQYVRQVADYAKVVVNEQKTFMNSFLRVFAIGEKRDKVELIEEELTALLHQMENCKFDWAAVTEHVTKVDEHARRLLQQKLEIQEQTEFENKKEVWLRERKELESELDRLEWTIEQTETKRGVLLGQMEVIDPGLQSQIDDLELKQLENDESIQTLEQENSSMLLALTVERATVELCAYLNQEINNFNKLKNKERKKHFTAKVGPKLKAELENVGKGIIYSELTENNRISDAKEMMQYMMKQLGTHPDLRMKENENLSEIVERYDALIKERSELGSRIQEVVKKSTAGKTDDKKQMNEYDIEIKKLQNELGQVQKKLEKMGMAFTYTPGAKESRSPFQVPANIRFPEERIPSVGELYRIGQLRQLAIANEGDLLEAESEALRLKAEIVYKQN